MTSEQYEIELFLFFQSKSGFSVLLVYAARNKLVCSCTSSPCLKNCVLPLVSSDAWWEMQLLWQLDRYLYMKAFAKWKYSHSLLHLDYWVFEICHAMLASVLCVNSCLCFDSCVFHLLSVPPNLYWSFILKDLLCLCFTVSKLCCQSTS